MRKEKMIRPYPGMKIYEDVNFLPGVYNFYGQKGITICASNITMVVYSLVEKISHVPVMILIKQNFLMDMVLCWMRA